MVTNYASNSALPPSTASAAAAIFQIQCWLVPSAQAQGGQAGGFSFGACPELETARMFRPELVRIVREASRSISDVSGGGEQCSKITILVLTPEIELF